jgi:hypothetical protein
MQQKMCTDYLSTNSKWQDCDWWLGRSGPLQFGYHSIFLEAVWRTTKKEISGPQTRFRHAMYLPNKKQSANNYGDQESTAEHSSSEDEVL